MGEDTYVDSIDVFVVFLFMMLCYNHLASSCNMYLVLVLVVQVDKWDNRI